MAPLPLPAIQPLETRTLLAAPLGRNDQFSLLHDRIFVAPVSLLANDTSPTGAPLTAQLVDSPTLGSLVLLADGRFTYTPAAGYTGTLQFTYQPFDGLALGNLTTVSLTVGNTLPLARADSYTCTTDHFDTASAGASSLLANDWDRDGDTLQPVITALPAWGTLSLTSGGHFLYIPQPNRFGVDRFRYRAHDGVGESDEVEVTINVVSPFAASLNLADVPLAPGLSQGQYAVTPLTGAVQFSHSVGPLTLRYDSVEANPQPLVSLETRYELFRTPDRLEAQFTFNGTAQPSVWFNTSQLFAQTPLRFSFQAQSGLATGMYAWSIRLIAHFGSQTATREFTGVTPVVNRSASTFGSGWSLASIDHLVTIPAGATPAGQLLVLGSGGALFFEATGPTSFASPAGPLAFSTLAKLADGSFVLTAPTGETTAFDRFGQLASRTDLNGNKTTYTYYYGPNYGTKPNPPPQLKFITDPFGRVVTLTYGMNGLYSALQVYDPSRVHTPQYDTAGQLTSLTSPDPDGATGPLPAAVVQYEYDTSRRVIRQTLPENRTTLFSYDDAGRIQTVTQSDLSLRRFQPQQTLGWVNPTGGLGTSDRPAPLYRDGVPMGFQVNELGQQTRWRTDRFGFLIRQQTSLGTVTLIERDANGLPTWQIAPDPDDAGPLSSPETRWRYDARGNLVELVQPDGAVQQWAYHATLNRPTEWTDAKGAAWRSSYDTRGNQLTTTNPLGAVTTFTYTTRGQVASIRQPDPLTGAAGTGPLTSFSWSTTNGQLATLTNPDLSKQTFTTNLWGEQLTATDELARKVTSTRDALGRLLTLTRPDPDGTGPLLAPVIRLAWDAANRLVSQTDPLGQVTQYRYHSRDWVEEVIAPDPDGPTGPQSSPVTTNTYNAAGWLIAQIDPLNAVTQFAYDADGVLTQRTLPDPDGTGPRPAPVEWFGRDRLGRVVEQRDPLNRVTQFEYDPVGRVVRSTSPLGAETRWQYDIAGQLLSETLPDPDGPGPLASPIHSSTYDSLGRVVSQTNALGNVTQFTYNHLDQLTSATQPDPDGNGPLSAPVWQWAYNTRGWVTAETDPLGFITRHTYDTAGQLKTTTQPDPDDAGPLLAPVTTYTYDPLGRITAVKNPLGFTTSYGYDAADRLLSTKDPRGAITRQGYDNLGRLITLTQPDPDTTGPLVAPVTRWSYDAAGQMVSRVNPLGHVATWQYDPLGRTTAQTDEVGRTMAWEYDVASQLVRQTDPLGNSLHFLYDAEGREVQVTLPDPDPLDALPAPSRQTHYDLLGRVIGQTDERGGLTEFTYDLQDNLRQLTDPAGNSTRFEYDRLDRQIAEVNPLGQSRTWSYNARGNLLAYVDRNGRRTQWAYDPLGRTASEQWLAGESLVYTLQYTYDVGSRVTVAQDPLSRYSYVYNQNDQITKVTSGNVGAAAVVLDSVYDLLGRRTELKATVAGKADFRNTYQYDA
ncbi:MAG: Ig-like domain-containing protein, partial [Planctomycetaceae bacterium]